MSAITDLQQTTYDDLRNNEYGFSSSITRTVKTGFNPTTGGKTEVTTYHTGYIVFKKINETKSIPKYFEINEGDKSCLFAGNGFEPFVNDSIFIDKNYQIKLAIDYSAGTKSLFFLIIR